MVFIDHLNLHSVSCLKPLSEWQTSAACDVSVSAVFCFQMYLILFSCFPGIHQQHIRPHPQLRIGVTLTGKEKPPVCYDPPHPSCPLLSLFLTICSRHAITPNGLWWLKGNSPPPLFFQAHEKPINIASLSIQYARLDCMASTTLWDPSYKQFSFGNTCKEVDCMKDYNCGYLKKPQQLLRGHGHVEMPLLRDCFPSLKWNTCWILQYEPLCFVLILNSIDV